MVILIVYLTLKDLVLFFVFIHLFNILLFYWVYFTSFLDHYIEQKICLCYWHIMTCFSNGRLVLLPGLKPSFPESNRSGNLCFFLVGKTFKAKLDSVAIFRDSKSVDLALTA